MCLPRKGVSSITSLWKLRRQLIDFNIDSTNHPIVDGLVDYEKNMLEVVFKDIRINKLTTTIEDGGGMLFL